MEELGRDGAALAEQRMDEAVLGADAGDAVRVELDPVAGAKPSGSRVPSFMAASHSRKKCSKPAGEMISRIRHGSSPALQNVCHWSRA